MWRLRATFLLVKRAENKMTRKTKATKVLVKLFQKLAGSKGRALGVPLQTKNYLGT